MVHTLKRCVPRAGVRLHVLKSALRQELEERPRKHGRQGRHARAAFQSHAPGRGTLPRHPLQRWSDAFSRQPGVEDEPRYAPRQPRRRGSQRLVALYRCAGQGESNIRRWIIENDWLEAIVALPLNLFYNTGIATYIWVLTNRKPEHRR